MVMILTMTLPNTMDVTMEVMAMVVICMME